MFAAKWKKEAKLLNKAAKKFLNYKRDLLDEQQLSEIDSRREDVSEAIKSGDKEKCKEACNQLEATCENALPRYKQPGWLEENIEVIFVAVVIALGLRAYVVQPFRIPTGSMQPTLNGMVAKQVASDEEFPNFAVRQMQRVTHGRTYVDLVLEEDKRLRRENPIEPSQPLKFLPFFASTKIHFDDGSSMTFPGPEAQLMNYDPESKQGFGFRNKFIKLVPKTEEGIEYLKKDEGLSDGEIYQLPQVNVGGQTAFYYQPVLKKGTVIARGYIDSGDLILVDKISYHFKSPKRGEVFVFDTREIKKIQAGENPGSHYIKRLAGVPGDELQIRGGGDDKAGVLYINGKKAQELGFQKVMSEEGDFRGYKPMGLLNNENVFKARFSRKVGQNEYIALGDNSFNSSDSRDWGTVKEFNLMGPAFFSLWPFKSGHWGVIK